MSGATDKRFPGVVDIEGVRSGRGPTIYVYEAPVRLWHWVNALCVAILMVSGYLIGAPPPTVAGEASAHFVYGDIRFIHFAAGQVLTVFFLMRIYWAFVGNRHARQIFYLPFWSRSWWAGVIWEAKWYLFLTPEPKKYVAHNPLAHLAMFFTITLGTIGMIISGFALYSEDTGIDSWQAKLFGWVFVLIPNTQDVRTLHHLGMWVMIVFTILHIYAAVREEIMSRQTMIATIISGERQFRDDRDD